MEVPIAVCFQNAASCPWVSSLAPVGGDPTGVTNELLIPAGVSSPVNVIVINLQVLQIFILDRFISQYKPCTVCSPYNAVVGYHDAEPRCN